MKKLFNYALLAAALLVGVNVNAQNNCMVQIGDGQPQAANFVEVLTNINGADYINQSVVITLSEDISIANPNDPSVKATKYYDFNIFPGKTNTIDVTIDLNGHNISGADNSFYRIRIFKGKLTFTGKGVIKTIETTTIPTEGWFGGGSVVTVVGTGEDVEDTYAELVVDKDVTIVSPLSYGATLMYAQYGSVTGDTKTNVSNGAVLTVKGTIKASVPVGTNGTMSYVTDTKRPSETFIDTKRPPVVNIESTAVLIGNHDEEHLSAEDQETHRTQIEAAGYSVTEYMSTSTCLYAPGYAIYNISGRIEGGIGIYAKGGKLNIDGAVIKAVSEHYFKPIAYGNGCIGSGSALVLDSHSGYGQFDGVSIANSTISSDNGYAIEETVTLGNEKLPVIKITSGTFVGGLDAITTTDEAKQEIINRGDITGGEWHNTNVNQYLTPGYSTLEYVDGDGKHYQVVVPIGADDWQESIEEASKEDEGAKYAKVAENETVSSNTTVEFVRIEEHTTVTVGNGATLDAGTLMLEGDAQIVVKAGATLIVSGEQGAYTFDEKSIIIETNTVDYGQLLINPAVALNTTPKATVRFNSDAFRDEKTGNHAQLFGNPMVSVDKINAYNVKDNASATAAIYFDVWKNSQWNYIGGFNVGQDLDKTKLEPFGLYCITSKNIKDSLLYYVMEGNLVGNSQPQDFNLNYGWTSAANSWTGNMGGQALVDALNALVDGGAQGVSVNAYMPTIEGNTITWNAYGMAELIDGEFHVEPMQPMMFDNEEAKIIPTDIMSYENLVWNSRPSAPKTQAPRYATNDIKKANIRVTSTEGVSDRVVVAETEQYSDPRYSARKYMNDEICVYVNADKNYDVYMVENVENTYVGFNCKNAGKYTVSFEKVSGNFALIDLKTNARIEMNEGTTYEFLAEAGEDAYRFVIVAGAQAPTEMQKTKTAVKANKALVNGQIVISNGERFFNVLGNEVK